MRLAVDVLGGDHAPREILLGVSKALAEGRCAADQLVLVGPAPVIEDHFRETGTPVPEIAHTEQVIEGHESPIEGLRKKPDASVSVCVGLVREGRAKGMLAFGNTGATVASATIGLKLLPGIRRPGIAVMFNGAAGRFVALDMGANPSPKPLHLFHYALMGDAYARDILSIESPRIGLLNIGGEEGKGTPTTKETYKLLSDSEFNFIGNLEGHELFDGSADVMVTDGVVGNMVLKVVEGFSAFLIREFKRSAAEAPEALKAAFRRVAGAADFSEVGGATLLGVNGVVVIGHGRSRADAVPAALRTAFREMELGVVADMKESLARNAGPLEVPPGGGEA